MQNDLTQIIANTMKDVGPGGTTIFRNAFEVLGNLYSKKRDWIQETELVKRFPVPGGPDQLDKNWPIMVGMMQKMAEPGLWDPANFEPNSIASWLAQMSELLAYSREMSPELNEISYQVVSQSSDRAEVEVTLGSTPPTVFNFQKVGDIWVVPEIMVSLRENVDKELAEAPTLKALKTVMAALGIMTPTLKAMDQAKTREDFDKAYKQSGLAGMLGSIPAAPSGQAGGSMLPGLPAGLPGLPMGIPGLPGAPGGTPGP
jgi:hypothetical protein